MRTRAISATQQMEAAVPAAPPHPSVIPRVLTPQTAVTFSPASPRSRQPELRVSFGALRTPKLLLWVSAHLTACGDPSCTSFRRLPGALAAQPNRSPAKSDSPPLTPDTHLPQDYPPPWCFLIEIVPTPLLGWKPSCPSWVQKAAQIGAEIYAVIPEENLFSLL